MMTHARNHRSMVLTLEGFILALLLATSLHAQTQDAQAQNGQAQESPVTVQFDTSKVGPRAVEYETGRRIVADYRFAWTNLEQALEANTPDPLEGLFVGSAKKWLTETVASQQESGLQTKYLNQNHKLEATLYAPEGDVMELHDTAEYQMQVLDHGKLIHDDHVVTYYIVLMTPGADRWVVRQLQAVSQF
jgi:hemin uptake protein HemP